MTKFVAAAILAVVGGCLCAQTQEGETRKPKATTWRGTLVESGCHSPVSARQKTTGDSGSYPAGTPRTSFGLITADGKCIPFDVNSNEKVAGILKINDDWDENTVNIKPTKAEIVGTEEGGELSVDEIHIK